MSGQTLSLFDEPVVPISSPPATAEDHQLNPELGQWMTPMWVPDLLIERHFANLSQGDALIDAGCGRGAFLSAFPKGIPALGVEVDPVLAEQARRNSGRQVITGDFRTVALDLRPTAIIGNPPFEETVLDGFLARSHDLLPDGGRIGWVLPAYSLQTPSRTLRYSENWSLQAEMIPRTLFPGLKHALSFVIFTKDRRKAMVGMALYAEAFDVSQMPAWVREELENNPRSWRAVIANALIRLGGRAKLDAIYSAVAPRRPTGNPNWKAQIRKCLRDFSNVGPAEYSLAA